jgi:hypothetical protein
MKKILSFIIESVFWLQLFFTPVIIGGLTGLFIYIANENLLWLTITILSVSVVLGFLYAEKIRKKYGTSRYVSKGIGTPDIWPDEYPEEIAARVKEQQINEPKKK